MSRRSSHSSAHPAEALPEGMTPPLRYAQSTDNEEIVINIDHLDYSDNTVPGDNFGVGGHTNYQDYGRDVPPYFIQQPRARSFGDEQRAFASGFRRRAHSDSAPFSATTSLASEYTADNTFALADDFSDSSELPRISIPNQTSQWAPRGHLHPIQTSSLSPLSLSPHSPFPVAEWRSNASDASSIRSSPSPSPSIGILSPLPPLPPAPPFLSPDHPSYLGIYSGGSPTLHPHSRSNSRTRAHEVDSRDGEGAVVGGWSAYDHHQPPAGSSANGMDHRIGSLKLEDDFSLGPSLISPNPVWHYGSAASHQAQGAAFQTQTDVAWHTGERQVHDQHHPRRCRL
ncbi:hypothetical protein B0H17DRAFT_514760 [Mycena rosella]|uniref:Uncharacterized protein n=1 Tax=Mycena rosella TaxID=1033263 RepID=A0AAD7GXF3_MYCRO|nr:hypothetical protein B0H17DRAFT_514760 [Mycena rosella]